MALHAYGHQKPEKLLRRWKNKKRHWCEACTIGYSSVHHVPSPSPFIQRISLSSWFLTQSQPFLSPLPTKFNPLFSSLQFLKSLTQPMPVPLHQQSWQVSRRGLKIVGFDNPDTAFMKIQTPPFPPLTAWVCHYSIGTMTMHLKACWTLVLNPRALYSLEKLSRRKSISKTGWFTYCQQVFAGMSFKSALMLPSGLIVSTSMSFPCL